MLQPTILTATRPHRRRRKTRRTWERLNIVSRPANVLPQVGRDDNMDAGTANDAIYDAEFLRGASTGSYLEDLEGRIQVLGIDSRRTQKKKKRDEDRRQGIQIPDTPQLEKARRWEEFTACVWPPFCRASPTGQRADVEAILENPM